MSKTSYNMELACEYDEILFLTCPKPKKEEQGYNCFYKLRKNDKCFVINQKLEQFLTTDYDDIKRITRNAYHVQKKGKWGILNDEFLEIIPCIYDFEQIKEIELNYI